MHEEVRRLNFYSRYTRVKERREIESLYTLLGAGKD